jgi:hypothetical protein
MLIMATKEQAALVDGFMVHWAMKGSGKGLHSGFNEDAETWEMGKYNRKKCLGHMRCDRPKCQVIVRPKTTEDARNRQLRADCQCGGQLTWYNDCPARIIVRTWAQGVRFEHQGQHNHPALTHELHITSKARAVFERLVYNNSKLGALALTVGAQGRVPVSDIAAPLTNRDRVRHELKKTRKKQREANDLLASDLADWAARNEEYVRWYHNEDGIEVLCLQSAFMATLPLFDLDSEESERNEELQAVLGHVSDAAQGFWRNKNDLLVVSSVYSCFLLEYVPVVVTYMNGQSAEHYRHHFAVLFTSICDEADRRKLSIEKLDFSPCAGVCVL